MCANTKLTVSLLQGDRAEIEIRVGGEVADERVVLRLLPEKRPRLLYGVIRRVDGTCIDELVGDQHTVRLTVGGD
jgi:hypothetical protein